MDIELEEAWLQALREGHLEFLANGGRSTKKLIPVHGKIAEILRKKLGAEYEVISLDAKNNKEKVIAGKYYSKKVDICVSKASKALGVILFKGVEGNFAQNSNNYPEAMLGETANLKEAGLICAEMLVLPKRMPYYKKGRSCEKMEEITSGKLAKYLKLEAARREQAHIPDLFYLLLIKNGNEKYLEEHRGVLINEGEFKENLIKTTKIEKIDIEALAANKFDLATKSFLKTHGDLGAFLDAFVGLIKNKEAGV